VSDNPALVPPEEMQTLTFDVTRITDPYVDIRTGETRVAVIGVFASERGYESRVEVFKAEGTGVELVGARERVASDLGAAYVDLGWMRRELGVPDSAQGRISGADDRARAPDKLPGPRVEPTPEARGAAERPSGSEGPTIDEGAPPGEPDQAERAAAEDSSAFETPFSDAAEAWDRQVEQAERASDVLRGQLESYVDEGGSWVLGALGATALDVAGAAMHFTQGLADTARLGQGLSQGTWEGVREDAGRVLNVLPAGRAAKVLGLGLGVADAATAATQGSAAGVAAGVLGAVAAAAAKKGSAKKGKAGGKKNASNAKAPVNKQSFTAYEDLPLMKGQHRHHIALAGIFRRARSKALRDLELVIGSEYLLDLPMKKGGTHHILHRIVNVQLKIAGLFPGRSSKRSFTKGEVERALRVLSETYRTEKLDDFADYVDDLIDQLKREGKL
jgi:hypothetical protein